jgi:hypothetical protein
MFEDELNVSMMSLLGSMQDDPPWLPRITLHGSRITLHGSRMILHGSPG